LVARYRGLEPVIHLIHRKTKKERDIMSKSNSRKGYAVGALVALVSSLFTFAPAQADANGPVTLLPTEGSTFNTIIGSPISLVSIEDPTTVTDARMAETFYVISNPDEAEITITLVEDPTTTGTTFGYITYDADGVGTARTGNLASVVITNEGDAGMVVTTTESKIAVSADYSSSNVVALNTIKLDSNETTTTTVTVQTLVDIDNSAAGARGNKTGFDKVSNEETVVMYAAGSVTATTTIASLVPGETGMKATVVYGGSVNPYFVDHRTSVGIFKLGSAVALSSSPAEVIDSGTKVQGYITTSAATSVSAGVITAGYSSSDLTTQTDLLTGLTMADWDASIYSAQAYYYNGTSYVTVGAASAVANVSAGSSATVDGLSVSHVATTNTKLAVSSANATLSARTGTKALTLNAQIRSGSADLAFANAEIKAVLSENAIAAASSITITGAATALVDGGSAVTAYGRTDSDGKASFTITSNNGTKADSVNVHLYVKNSSGVWVSYTSEETTESGVNVVWADAVFTSFSASPAVYISGANPTVTFKVKDQFGGALNSILAKPLSVYVVASFGGVTDATEYAATANVVGGEATFTFANFAPAGGLAQLKASLYSGGVGTNATTEHSTATVNVYNTAASSEIAVVDSFATAVSYVDYVTGDTATAAVATAVAAAGLSAAEGVAITGTVLNAVGVGQPGVAVTLAAEGVLFLADGVYSLDTVSTNANEFGAFSVTAIAHTVHAKGTTVTITADGLSATTLLVTYLPDSLDDENLNLSWTVPANVVKNTTYAVTVSLTDKWGNPVAANTTSTDAISVIGAGSVEVNSVATAVGRNFDKNGQATVFLRSVKDVAGPGSLTATLRTTGWTYPTGVTGADATLGTVGTFNASDLASTAWDESAWSNELSVDIEVLDVAPAASASQKVNAGSFKGYVALYAKGYAGQRMSAKVGKDWVVVPALASNFERVVEFTGAGVDVAVRIYIDRVLIDTINLTTK
jgi:hypothetical protein